MHIETLEGVFIVSPQCAKQPSSETYGAWFLFFYCFEDSGAPIGICFLEMSTATGKVFPLAPCLQK